MLNTFEIMETIKMIQEEHLDIRTITMGISLRDCCDSDARVSCQKIYDKITSRARRLVATGEAIQKEYGIPIINKRISVTPISLIAESCGEELLFARTLEKAAQETGVNFIGGFSALVHKGYTPGDRRLIETIPYALTETEHVCASVNVCLLYTSFCWYHL